MTDEPIPLKPARVSFEAACRAACANCAAGHEPTWQLHSREWVHRRYTVVQRGALWAISTCGANHIRKERM